jgi:hypothetical protein
VPFGRSIARTIVPAISAVLAHMLAQRAMSCPAIESAHMVQACSHATAASMHSCITDMSMSCMGMSFRCISIICMVVFMMRTSLPRRRARSVPVPSAAPVTADGTPGAPGCQRKREARRCID